MGEVAQRPAIKLTPEGTFRDTPLARLLGAMGVLKANCLLELTHQKLLRRVVVEKGRIQALLSNARDDRFLDWLIASNRGALPIGPELTSALSALESTPLTAGAALRLGIVSSPDLPGLLRTHLLELLEESAGWPQCAYRIQPGKVQLGDEPVANLHATAAGLVLGRQAAETHRRSPRLPEVVISQLDLDAIDSALELDENELELLERCSSAIATSQLAQSVSSSAAPTLSVLLTTGLLAPTTLTSTETSPGEKRNEVLAGVMEDELKRWLLLAKAEDLAGLLGVRPTATKEQVREAYYRTVRRFHPDRFREGPLSSYYEKIDSVFRLVHEALGVLTDPRAKKRWDDRHKRPAAVDPETIAKQRMAKARKAASAGRRSDAVTELERGVAASPNHVDMSMGLALLLVGNPRRRRDAVAILERLAREQPTRGDVLAALALALRKTDRTTDAEAALAKAKMLDASSPLVRALGGSQSAITELRGDPFVAPLL